jgi:hypothetical protein
VGLVSVGVPAARSRRAGEPGLLTCDHRRRVAERAGLDIGEVLDAYLRLRSQRVLVLEADGSSIRMAPPFSRVPTQHVVKSDGVWTYANCARDALGVPAALEKAATVPSRCELSGEPLHLEVGLDGPAASDWLFHSLVPAANWWDDIVSA